MKSTKDLTTHLFSTTTVWLLFLFGLLSQYSNCQQLAFPTATGAGAYATGGRGGSVSIVTNLNDSGSGSLRSFANVSNTTILFNISGIIKLKRPLYFYGNNVTIAGQTAPDGGITIEGARVLFDKNKNLICRYIRFRGGYYEEYDTVEGFDLVDVIFDHCSISFGADEAFSSSVGKSSTIGRGLTIQNCLIAESKTGGIMRGDDKPGNLGGISMIGNVFYNITHRFPNLRGDLRFDIINNYIHNAKWRLIRGVGGYKLNQLGNFYDYGNSKETLVWDSTMNMHTCSNGGSNPLIYAKGNNITGVQVLSYANPVTSSIKEVNSENSLSWKYYSNNSYCGYGKKNKGDQLEKIFFKTTQYSLNGKASIIHKATDLKNIIVPNVGASKRLNADGSISDSNDVLDSQWKKNILEGKYVANMDRRKYSTPAIKSLERPKGYDSDNDGMPDEWELLRFNTLKHDGKIDSNGNGYTDLEEFLNQVDLVGGKSVTVKEIKISPNKSELQVNKTLQLTKTFNPENTTNQIGMWSSSNDKITKINSGGLISSLSEGKVILSFKSSDGGIEGKSEITVLKEVINVNAGPDQTIYLGEGTTLTATGGSTYHWNTGAKTANINIAPSTSRTYTVTAYDSKGKISGEAQVYVKVINKSKAPARGIQNLDICNNLNVTLSVSTRDVADNYIDNQFDMLEGEFITLIADGANIYKWSNGETGSSITVSPKETTIFQVIGYEDNCTSEKSVTVNVYEKIIADVGKDVTICNNENFVLTAKGTEDFRYLWSTGEINKSIIVNPKIDTEYSVILYHALDSDIDNVMVYVGNYEGKKENQDLKNHLGNGFYIHPNPTHGELHINISGLTGLSSLHLYDLNGKSIYSEIIKQSDKHSYFKILDLSDYESGIYLLKLIDNQKVITKKVVLK
ncbi:T9SS type A sorting domain-containing protein [Gelidibacter sp.]|uniref:T9SS type A sorting domain-containing protein n=1 Tax=Gelidibacter sp. TaxID=2018083 RepID=UPI0032668746